MHFVIMGCGRVGASLAHTLGDAGHSVAVIDQNESAFRRLPDEFTGTTVTGMGFDFETLEEADTADAYAFAAVSSGDNSNILGARVARETFGVAHVAARIYDPGRAEIYQRLGIPTVATVRWTADQVLRRILPQGSIGEYRESSGRLVLAEVNMHRSWIGRSVADIEHATNSRVCYLTRRGEGVLPTASSVIQQGDLVHVMLDMSRRDVVTKILGGQAKVEEE